MKNNTTLRFILIVVISILLGYYLGVNKVNLDWKSYKPQVTVVNKEPPISVSSSVDFSLFWSVWDKLQNEYYDKSKLDPQKMLNGAISGMVQSLGDPYTLYLPKPQNTSFKEGLAGQFSGIGAELGVGPDNKQIIVISPLVGSPAEVGGIKAGDEIIKVDGEATADWTLSQAVSKIRGPKGTAVTLTVLHKDSKAPADIKITRDTITVKSVDGWIKNIKAINGIKLNPEVIKGKEQDEIAYVRLSQFGDVTNQDWMLLINKLYGQIQKDPPSSETSARQGKKVKGMVLDLRNNPGGYLTDAVFITGEFLKQGTTVVVEDSPKKGQTALSVSRKGILYDIPLVVLINKGSASASEIVSAALKENNRATLIGETSFGKGTIQQAEDLGNGAGLHVTIAKWLTPKKVWINGKGLTPDIQVSLDSKEPSHDTQLEKAVEFLLK